MVERLKRFGKRKAKMIGVCLLAMLSSPFIASITIRGISYLSVEANKINIFSPQESKSALVEYKQIDSYPDYEDSILSYGFGWEEEFEDETYVSDANTDNSTIQNVGVKPYPESLDNVSGNVVQTSYGAYGGNKYFNLENSGQVMNNTSITNYNLSQEGKLKPEFKIELNGEPQVLIMHTHTTESFEPYERNFYDSSFNYRTTDSTKNVVMVADEIAKQLEQVGITTIHDSTIHDYPSYNGSYVRSAETVKAILAQYPSIKVVLDVHRDAIISEGDLMQPVATINGKKAAQVMIISGCDDGTLNMPNYMQNFRLASLFQQKMEGNYSGLTRPIMFDYRKYNQDLTTGSLLLEVGSHGNTIEQARYSGELIGKSIADALVSLT